MKKTDERLDKLAKNVGGNNRSIGELVETLIAARLWEKFAGYPYNLKRAYQRIPIYDENNEPKTDIDILLLDKKWCMAVEVKREADKDDVEKHLKRMDLIRKYPPAEVVGKKMLGAIAGGIVEPEAKEYAQKNGLFVLELKGESVALLDPPEGFTPREW
jgi:predicted AAA+ superfamily ATPase